MTTDRAAQVRAPLLGALEAYRRGSAAGPSPLKIAKHGCDQVALATGSSEKLRLRLSG